MPCFRRTARCAISEPYSLTSLPRCCYYHLIQVMHYVGDLFREANIPYWLHYGSLLGAVREQQIIPWDADGDIGVFSQDRQKIYDLTKQIKKDGFHFYELEKNLFQVMYSETNKIYCDIWLFDKIGASQHIIPKPQYELAIPQDTKPTHDRPIMRCNLPWLQTNHTTDFPYWFVSKLWETKLNNKRMPCPRFPKKFIELTYGPNWKTPIGKQNLGGNYYPLSHWFDFIDKRRSR